MRHGGSGDSPGWRGREHAAGGGGWRAAKAEVAEGDGEERVGGDCARAGGGGRGGELCEHRGMDCAAWSSSERSSGGCADAGGCSCGGEPGGQQRVHCAVDGSV